MIIPWKKVTKTDRFKFELFEQMIIKNDYVKNRAEAEDALLYFVACHQYAVKLDVGRLRKMILTRKQACNYIYMLRACGVLPGARYVKG